MSKFLSSKYCSLESYTPGEQPVDMVYTKLNTNESPYPPSEKVIKAISAEEIEKLRLYSDPESVRLKKSIADLYGVEKENVFVSNGSDDILNFAFMAFTDENQGVLFPEISYGFYEVFAQLHKTNYKKVPLKEDFSIDSVDYIGQNKMVVIANPNAPTGKIIELNEIEEILKTNPNNVVVIDEAYVDFGGKSCVDLTFKYENLLVVQTFSKSRSLAGARLGFAIGNKALIDDLEKIKYSTNPYNVNRLSALAGVAAIEDNDYYMDNCKKIQETREYTSLQLKQLGFTVIPSKANFIFVKSDKISGEDLYLNLKKRGILIRHFSNEKISQYNRITIGTPEEMKKLVAAIKEEV